MININGIKIDCDSPYPCWIRIEDSDNTIMIHHKDLQSVIDALYRMKREVFGMLPEYQRHEV